MNVLYYHFNDAIVDIFLPYLLVSFFVNLEFQERYKESRKSQCYYCYTTWPGGSR
jgi:hypothetical protein